MKITPTTRAIARIWADHDWDWMYGLALANAVNSTRPGVYALLRRWCADGLLEDRWEASGSRGGRAPRHYYRPTPRGIARMQDVIVVDNNLSTGA